MKRCKNSWAYNIACAFTFAIFLIVPNFVMASTGVPDVTFTTNNGSGFNGLVLTSVIQADGKIVVGGRFTTLNHATVNNIARFNSDGTPDTTFTTNTGTGFNDGVNMIVKDSNNKLLVVGDFTTFKGVTTNRMVLLNSDGTKDTTFNANLGTGFSGRVISVAFQSDGKIIVVGDYLQMNGVTVNRVVRLNADGTRDATFTTNIGSGFNLFLYPVIVQLDDKIIIAGSFTAVNGTSLNRLARLNSDGTLDTTFNTNLGTGFDSDVTVLGLQEDGKIIVGGWYSTFNDVTVGGIVRLNTDGTKDTDFSTNIGSGINQGPVGVYIQPSGRIIIFGYFITLNDVSAQRIVRLNTDGTRDEVFTANLGSGFNYSVFSVTPDPSGYLIVGGEFTYLNEVVTNGIARLSNVPGLSVSVRPATAVGLSSATLPANITEVGGFTPTERGINYGLTDSYGTNALTEVGSFAVGAFSADITGLTCNTTYHYQSYAIDADGTKYSADATFTTLDCIPTVLTGSASSVTTSSATLSGEITSTGLTNTSSRGVEYGLTAGYGTTLSDSGTFSTGIFTKNVSGLTCSTTYHFRAYATNSEGTGVGSDATFTTAFCPSVTSSIPNTMQQYPNGSVYSSVVASDGTVYIGGNFDMVGAETRNYVASYKPDGTLSTFAPVLNGTVYALALSKDESILYVGGSFSGVGIDTRNKLAAITVSDGLVTTFNPNLGGGGGGGRVSQLIVSADGNTLYASGGFTTADGVTRSHLASWNTVDGTLSTFDAGTINGGVPTMALSADGSTVYVGGAFSSINGTNRNYLASINTSDSTLTNFDPDMDGNVTSLLISPDGTILYSVGWFSMVNGGLVDRSYFASFNISDGSVTTFSPYTNATGTESDHLIAISKDGSTLYLGGQFDYANSESRNYLASFRISDGLLTEFNPNLSGFSKTLAHSPDGTKLYVGGSFDSVGGDSSQQYFTSFTTTIAPEPVRNQTPARQYGSVAFGCKDTKATNYQPFGANSPSMCRYAVVDNTNNTLGTKGQCSATQLLTQNLKTGARNGKYNSYTKSTVKEVKILQAHMNRLGFASGKEDGILGPITDGAIKRMQKFLGTKQDGMVGPNTRGLINTSCGEKV